MPAHRPYALNPNSPPSVTQVLDTLSKGGLSWGAAKETANFAVRHYPRWSELKPDDAVSLLYRHHRGVWDHRALIGTAIHSINAQWCEGRTVRVLDVVQEMRDQSKLWHNVPETELYAEILPMADALGKFWSDVQPVPVSWEQVVRHRNGDAAVDYIGQPDWRADVGGETLLLDLKTTGAIRGKGKYFDQWRLQLAGYRYCTEAVVYGDDNTEKGTIELPEVDGCAIVQVYTDGHVEFEPVEAGAKEHEIFLALRRVYGWRKGATDSPGNPSYAAALAVS